VIHSVDNNIKTTAAAMGEYISEYEVLDKNKRKRERERMALLYMLYDISM
jgi:hypothetical protein